MIKMINKIGRLMVIVSVVCVLAVFVLSGCNSQNSVSFETFGGTVVAAQSVAKNGHATKPTEPTKESLTFEGWYKDAGYVTVFDFEVEKISKSVTVYAKWVTNENSFSFDVNEDGQSVTITGLKVEGEFLKHLIIPATIDNKPVTQIADEAFYNISATEVVTFSGQSVTKIGKYAFMFNVGLKQITLPESLTYIDSSAFASCQVLTQITIPDGVGYVGEAVFFDCAKLTTINTNQEAMANWHSGWKKG